MSISLPGSPTVGQTASANGRDYVWTGYSWDVVADPITLSWSAVTNTPTTLSGYGITDAVGTSDARLTDARDWTAETVSQSEAETGTATTRRAWTAARVFQAIAAWWAASAAKTKLDGIATGATANSTDSQLRDRTTHTGVQAISTVDGLETALSGKAASSHSHQSTDISDSTAAGRAILTAADAAAQRTAMGAAAVSGQWFTGDIVVQRASGTSSTIRAIGVQSVGALMADRYSADSFPPVVHLRKFRGTTSSPAAPQANDSLGIVQWQTVNAAGSAVAPATILAYAGSTPQAGESFVSGVMEFWTSTTTQFAARMRIASDGSQSSVIPGGTTLYPEFKCRAWVNFNGTGTVAIRGSGNVSSITDNSTGDYAINFTTAMPDANYAAIVSAYHQQGTSFSVSPSVNTLSTGSISILTAGNTSNLYDPSTVCVAVFR